VSKSRDPGRLTRLDRFSDLTDDEVALIASRGTQVHLPADWSLIWEKTPADKAYIILRGEVSVRRKGEEIARLGPGDTVGEAAIVGHKLRNASVVSLTELEVLHFTSEAVRQLLDEVPAFREALEQTTRDRLNDSAAS
jgi:CRP-like cAMP-binding protein